MLATRDPNSWSPTRSDIPRPILGPGGSMGSPRSPDPLSIRTDRRNGVTRVALEGELDLATVPVLEEHLAAIEHDGMRALVLDLRDLTFVDSSGLHAFLNA